MKAIVILFAVVCFACSEGNADLESAHELHVEAMAIGKEVKREIELLKADSTSLAQADSLSALLQAWEAAVVEVPGFDHVHEEGQHHHHNGVNIRESEQLDYQQQSLEAIIELKNSL